MSFEIRFKRTSGLLHERIKTGRLFQSSGAETAKAREPYSGENLWG